MSGKRILIVDDSRVAQLALRRQLEDYAFEIDTADSGEDALKLLSQHRPPAAIFLDHMMPGMDGFQALQAIKQTGATAAVPVVMYTSQEGEQYAQHARALGAAAVLAKPVKAMQLAKVLQQLQLLPEPVRAEKASPPPPPSPEPLVEFNDAPPPPASAHKRMVDEQRYTLRDELYDVLRDSRLIAPARTHVALVFALLAATATAALLAFLLYQSGNRANTLAQENARLQSAAERAAASPVATADATRAAGNDSRRDHNALLAALAWAINLTGEYDYDELPLGDARVGLVRDLVVRLDQSGFKGVVRLDTHAAEFCLERSEGVQRVPRDDAPIARCEVTSYTPEYAFNLSKRQSVAFARFLASPLAQGDIRVEIVPHGKDRPLLAYPSIYGVQTVGEWNRIARRNQRVEVTLLPSS